MAGLRITRSHRSSSDFSGPHLAIFLAATRRRTHALSVRFLPGKKEPRRDIVLMNAGAAIYVGGRAATLADGIRLAAESIDSGRAARKLDALVTATRGAA